MQMQMRMLQWVRRFTGFVFACGVGGFLLASCGGGGGNTPPSLPPISIPLGTCLNVTYPAPSSSSNNVVFNFDKPYSCGQFANGDWWVSSDSPGGTVRIVSVTPSVVAGKHGVEINPTSTVQQAFDDQAEVPYNAGSLANFPRDVGGGSSVVKAVSILPNPTSRPAIQFAAVLTVLDTPLAGSSQYFRPPYFGNAKPLYAVSDINLGVLPKLAATAVTQFDKPPIVPPRTNVNIQTVIERYTGVRLDHVGSFTARDIHPKDTMPDYGGDIARDNAVYLLRMAMADFDPGANTQHLLALVNYLQMAIDLQAMAVNGTKWNATGGHSNGRKLPLAFAQKAFGSAQNKTAFASAIATAEFDEDLLLYRSSVNNKVLYGQQGTDFQYWQYTINGGATGRLDVRDPYGYIDGGGVQVGDNAGYQFCCTAMPWKYTALAVYVLNLEVEFNGPLLLEYAERWVGHGVITTTDPCAPFDGITANPGLPVNYGVTYGPNGGGGCVGGSGRWPDRHGVQKDDGLYRSLYGNALWAWYKAQLGAKFTPYGNPGQ